MKTHSPSNSCRAIRRPVWKFLALALSILSLAGTISRADSYLFLFNRFGGVEIKTRGEQGEVRFFQETSRVRKRRSNRNSRQLPQVLT